MNTLINFTFSSLKKRLSLPNILRKEFTPLFTLLCTICILLFASCSETPNSVGKNLLPNMGNISIDSMSLFSDTGTTFRTRITGGSQRLLLGNSNGYKAVSLIQFTLPAFLDTVKIDSAFLNLTMNYFPFENGPYNTTINFYRLDSAHSNFSSFTWTNYADTTYSLSYQSVPTQLADSVLEIPLDSNMVRAKYGFLISSSLPFVGFQQFNAPYYTIGPEIHIVYSLRSDTTDSLRTYYLRIGKAAFVANHPSVPADSLVVQAGIADRTFLNFTSFDTLKKGTTIFKATLILHLNSSHIESNFQPLLLQLPFAANPDSLPSIAIQNNAHTATSDSLLYTFDLKEEVQSWINKTSVNYGVLLRAQAENNSLDYMNIINTHAPDSLRPRLEILYKKR